MTEAEIEALMAIYSSEGEFTLLNASDGVLTRNENSFEINIECEEYGVMKLTFTLPTNYPSVTPNVSISCVKLKRQMSGQMRRDLLIYANKLVNEHMIMDLIMWVKEHVHEYIQAQPVVKVKDQDGDDVWTALLHLDHMRSTQRYIKTIKSWTRELNLNGSLMFLNRLILILLQGKQDAIKAYICRQRTQKVDVDSSRKGCKERMMTVLFEGQLPDNIKLRCVEFQCKKLESQAELENEFIVVGLQHLYEEHVRHCYHS
ncbi:RWD domain-containing protein 3-like [Saccoglossus kowalevskii]